MKKIAVATEDQEKVTSHFGRAPFYRVFAVENGQVVSDEVRQKAYHGDQSPMQAHSAHGHGDMFAPINDCQVLLVGGMGEPAYEKAISAGLEVVLAGGKIDDVLQTYLRGELVNDPRRIHHH